MLEPEAVVSSGFNLSALGFFEDAKFKIMIKDTKIAYII